MKNYDKAHDLARQMRESETYQQFCAAKDKAFEQELNRNIYKQFVQLSREIQAAQFAGQMPSEELQQKYTQMMSILSLNADLSNFLMAEHRLNQMLSDIFKILGDAVQVDLAFLDEA